MFNIKQAVRYLGISNTLLRDYDDDHCFSMVEIIRLKSQLAFDKLELMNRFADAPLRQQQVVDEIMFELDNL